MHSKKIENIISRIESISENLVPPISNPTEHYRLVSSADNLYMLIGKSLDDYEDILVDLLEKEGWESKFSEKYVGERLRSFICRNAENKKYDVYKEFKSLIDEFENYDKNHQVYIPLVGVRANDKALKIGTVEILCMTPELLLELTDDINSIVLSSKSPADLIETVIKMQEKDLAKLEDCSFSRYEVVAEPDRARERAEVETRRAIDLLRFAIPAIYNNKYNVKVGILGEVPEQVKKVEPVIACDKSNYSLNKEIAGPISLFVINSKNLEVMERIGIFKISSILQKKSRNITNMESTLLRGLHWFGNSTNEIDLENAFLNLMVCLETFLTPKNSDPIASSIAEGVAFALGNDLETRKKIKKRIKAYYRKRSGISHGGDKSVHHSEILYLNNVVGNFTMCLLERFDDFKSVEDLLSWVEDQRLS